MAITKLVADSITSGAIANTPAFEATLTANQTVANSGTETKVQFNHEVLDTDNCYDNSTNYRFTPNVAGKYFVTLCVGFEGNSNQNMGEMYGTIFKNGSAYTHYSSNKRYSAISSWTSYTLGLDTRYTSAIIDMNGSTDYLEGYGTCFNGASNFYFNRNQSFFSAYKIIE